MLFFSLSSEELPSAAEMDHSSVDDGSPVTVETYTGPKTADLAKPRYPQDQIHRNQEGWVHLNFMVDTSGKPYEITVADSVGDKEFQDAAIRALKRTQFEPAKLDGVPIESGANYAYSFELTGKGSARRSFGRRYRKLLEAVEAGDRASADEALAELEADNLYENAYLQYGRFAYYRAWGTQRQQIKALAHAVGPDESTQYLPDKLMVDALKQQFALQVEYQDFGGALTTAERLYKRIAPDDELKSTLESVEQELLALRQQDLSFGVEGVIEPGLYSWHLTLFTNSFRIDQVRGRLAEIKLRCASSFVGFTHDEQLVYRIPEHHMPCDLEVAGDPGTEFRVLQTSNKSGDQGKADG